jgi:hypothetical protein
VKKDDSPRVAGSRGLVSRTPLAAVGMVTPERVFVVCGIDGHDGHERWRFLLEHDQAVPSNALAADNGLVYAATTKGLVYALRADDGGLAWQRQVTTLPRYPPPIDLRMVAGGGIVGVDYARPDIAPTDSRRITVLDSRDGTPRWVVHPAVISPWLRMWRLLRLSTMEEQAGFVLLAADSKGVYVTETFDRSHPHPDLRRTVLLDSRTGRRRWSTLRAAAGNFAGHWSSRTSLTVVAGTGLYRLYPPLRAGCGERSCALVPSRTGWRRDSAGSPGC